MKPNRPAQLEMIEVLSHAQNQKEYESRLPQAMEILEAYLDRLRSGHVSFSELAISKSLSQSPEAYRKESLTAIVAKELAGRGVRLRPGQSISYVITNSRAKVKSERARALGFIDGAWGYDVEKYESMLIESMEALLLRPAAVLEKKSKSKKRRRGELPIGRG